MTHERDYLASSLGFPPEEEEDLFWAGPEHGWVSGSGGMGPWTRHEAVGGPSVSPETKAMPSYGVPPPGMGEPVEEEGGPSALRQLGSAALSGAKTGAKAALAPLAAPVAGAVGLARPLAESALAAREEVRSMSPEERKYAGLRGTLYRAGEAGVGEMKEQFKPVGKALDVASEFIGGAEFTPTKRPAPTPDPEEPATGTTDQTLEPSSRIGVKTVDGRVVFTNIGVGGDPESKTGPGYRQGVSEFREKMRAHQAGLGPPPPDQILSQTGATRPGGHILGDPDAPIPGDIMTDPMTGEESPYTSRVSFPGGEIADPTKALTEEGWREMTPAGKRAYLGEVMEVGAARKARAEGTLAEHEAKMATDPEYAAQNRLYLYQHFVDMAVESNGVKTTVAATMAKFSELTGKVDGDPEYEAAEEEAKKAASRDWLNDKHGEVAKWDDVLSRNLGLTFS